MVYNVIMLLIWLGNFTCGEQLPHTESPLLGTLNRKKASQRLLFLRGQSLWEVCVGFAQGPFFVVFAGENKLLGESPCWYGYFQ